MFDLQPHPYKRNNPLAPSLDCIDPNKGYTPSNVQVVIHQYNTMKGEGSDHGAYRLAQAVVDTYKKEHENVG